MYCIPDHLCSRVLQEPDLNNQLCVPDRPDNKQSECVAIKEAQECCKIKSKIYKCFRDWSSDLLCRLVVVSVTLCEGAVSAFSDPQCHRCDYQHGNYNPDNGSHNKVAWL